MDKQQVIDVCNYYLKDATDKTARHISKTVNQNNLDYIHWMCKETIKRIENIDLSIYEPIKHNKEFEKAMRWLGFIQGVLWTEGIYTIDEMRKHNTGTLESYHPPENKEKDY